MISFDSKNEENAYMAFTTLKMDFEYQVPIMGGTSRRGGLVLDFLVYKAPLPVPINLQGAYWHSSAVSPYEPFEIAQIEEYAKVRGWDRLVLLEEEETQTVESAVMAIKQKVGYG